MSSLRSLLAATDFSDDAEHAAYRAAMLTAEHSAQLRLLHVVSRSSVDALRVILRSHPGAEVAMIEELSVMLGDLAAQLATQTGSKVSTALEIGDVLDEIVKASDPADLLVVGARGLNPIRDLLLGTTAERLLRKCRRPVLVVKQRPQGRYGKVLVAADLSPQSAAVLTDQSTKCLACAFSDP
jgi:nucleotide-binding universal stress UspA family protein